MCCAMLDNSAAGDDVTLAPANTQIDDTSLALSTQS